MPQLAREIIVHPVKNRHYSSYARGHRPCGGRTAVGLTRRQVSGPCGVKFITNSSCYSTQRDKDSAIARTELSRSTLSVRSPCELGHESPESYCAFFRMLYRAILVSILRSRVVAPLERRGCPIFYGFVPNFPYVT